MKKILITGSSGFIGFHLAKNLSKIYKVIGLDNHNNYYSKKIQNPFLIKNSEHSEPIRPADPVIKKYFTA